MSKFCLITVLQLWLVVAPAIADVPQNPLISGDAIFLSHHGLHKFNRVSLRPEWTILEGKQTFEPVIAGDNIYVGSSEGLFAVQQDSGDIIWHIEKQHTLFSPNYDGKLYAGSRHGELYAIDPHNGNIIWRQSFEGWVYSPAVFNRLNQLWTGGQSHKLYALDLKNGRLQSSKNIEQESIFSPKKLDENRLIVNLFSGNSLVIDAATGKSLAKLKGSSPARNLDTDERRVYRSHSNGSLFTFDKKSNQLLSNQTVFNRDLSIHPSLPGLLLLSNSSQNLTLLETTKRRILFSRRIAGDWFSPILLNQYEIVYFLKSSLQPNQIVAVRLNAKTT